MARRKPKQSRRKKKSLGALGLPPDQHKTREANFAKQADGKISSMREALSSKNCPSAFARLIDVVSYSGMAEAEAEGHGQSGTKYADKAVGALNEFRAACKVTG